VASSGTIQETIYSGPAPEPRPERVSDLGESELEPVESDLHKFIANVFGWIAASLFISAFFASYSDQWDQSSMSMLVGKTLFAVTGGMFLLAYAISRKAGKMMPGVAVATLVGYASLQGIVFGLSYRAAYDAPLAPVYLCMSILFASLALYGRYSGIDLTSMRGLLTGVVLAPILVILLKNMLGMQTIAALAACVCSWLMLALAGYRRDFLRDLPTTFDDDSHWLKAAAVGALEVCLNLVTVVLIVIQLRWLQQFVEDDKQRSLNSNKNLRVFLYRKN
jgi:FtsH-binding integral membrane protein